MIKLMERQSVEGEREREGDVLIYFRIKENRTVRCVRVLHFTVSAVIEECTKG